MTDAKRKQAVKSFEEIYFGIYVSIKVRREQAKYDTHYQQCLKYWLDALEWKEKQNAEK